MFYLDILYTFQVNLTFHNYMLITLKFLTQIENNHSLSEFVMKIHSLSY